MFGRLISRIVSAMPLWLQFLLGDAIGILWFDILRIRRRVALDNLRQCFPEWSEERRVQVARDSLRNVGRSFVEFLRMPTATPEAYKDHFIVEGREHLDRALAKGRGAFLLTLHLGNGDWATVGLQFAGIPLHVISKEMKFKPMNEFWFRTRESFGTVFIKDRGTSLQILKALKKNAVVVYMLDQFLGPPIGVKTTFFGRETGTPMGLAILAGRSGAAVVPTYTYRRDDGRTVIAFEPEIPFVEKSNPEETIQSMTQRYCDVLETLVRKYPGQWMWVHRRWKRYKH